MRLKQKLQRLVEGIAAAPKPRRDYQADQELRAKIKETIELPLAQFCKARAPFNMRHGLVFKLLKSSPDRLKNGILTSHDMHFWLRRDKVTPALWIIKLAGLKGKASRNQLLQWLNERDRHTDAATVLKWTKKWGIEEDTRATVIAASSKSVSDARAQYSASEGTAKERQIIGNALLQKVLNMDADEVFAFYKSLNKDIRTFQIMLGAMKRNNGLKKYAEQVWETAQRQAEANNIKIDDKLKDTYESLSSSSAPKVDASSGRNPKPKPKTQTIKPKD